MYLDSVILAKSATKAGKIASYRSEKANGTIDDGSVATDITFYFKTPFANIFDTLNNSNGDGLISVGDVKLLKKLIQS